MKPITTMHTLRLFFASLVFPVLFSSCGKETWTAADDSGGDAIREVIARIEPDWQTKTSYDNAGGKFVWSDGDQVAIHFSDGTYINGLVDSATGRVMMNTPTFAERDCYAVFPATAAVAGNYGSPSLQVKLPDSYDISAMVAGTRSYDESPCPMVAVNNSASQYLDFCHVGGLLRLIIKKESIPATTQKVRITFDKDITGVFTVDNPSAAPFISTQGSSTGNIVSFTLTADGSGVGLVGSDVLLNLPLPCGTYGSFTVELLDASGNILDTDTLTRNLSFERHHGKKILIFRNSIHQPSP